MFGPPSRRLSGCHINKDAGRGTVPNACEGDKTESGRTEGGLHPEGILDVVPGETKIPSPRDKGKGEANIPSPHGKKRASSEGWEEKAPKRGKMPLSGGSGLEDDVIAQAPGEGKPKS